MKAKHLIIAAGIVLLISLNIWAQKDTSIHQEYGIIQADDINIRVEPHIKAKVIGKLERYEFVYCIGKTQEKEKINEEEEYWYKIHNCDNKEGWVYGKYIRYIDPTKEPDKYFKIIIEEEIVNNGLCNSGDKTKIYKLKKENYHYIIDFESNEKVKMGSEYNIMGMSLLIFYRVINGELIKVIENMGKRNYIFDINWIIIYSNKGFDIYNTKKYREIYYETHCKNIPCKYYDSTGFYLRQDVISKIEECNTDWNTRLNCISYSEMEFNSETMEVVVYIRKDKDKLLKQERYKFKDGVFVKID